MTRRTIALLGAGASFDANIPLTNELAERLVAKFNAKKPRQLAVQELNFVYGAMVGHQGEDGSDPLRAVNIETLISAVRLLQSKDSHEVAPFVSSWKPGASGFASEPVSARHHADAVQRGVVNAIKAEHFGGDDLAEKIAEIAADVMAGPDATAYNVLEHALLRAIRDELQVFESVDYLRPLADLALSQPGGLDILTLNYDLTIEAMAAEAGVPVDRGIDRWIPGEPLTFQPRDGQINLYKLHGSVDWALEERSPNAVHPPRIQIVALKPEPDMDGPRTPPHRQVGLPWIVVGDREKLATDGPTLDLLDSAKQALHTADSLVVVGYSFGDVHINAIIRNWLAARADRTMTVLDPGWPPFDARETRGFLATHYGGSDRWDEPGAPPRIAVIAEGAAQALGRALETIPSVPDVTAEAAWATDFTSGEIVIDLVGYSLDNVTVSLNEGDRAQLNVFESIEAREKGNARWWVASSAQYPHVEKGSRLSVFVEPEKLAGTLRLLISGRDLVGHRRVRIELDGPTPENTAREEASE